MRDHLSTLARPAADPNLAGIFRTLRSVIGGSEMDLARRLGTDVSVVMDLEAGLVDSLPPWPTTVRIVERYGALAGVDVSAVLAVLARLTPQPPPPRQITLAPAEQPSGRPAERLAPERLVVRTGPTMPRAAAVSPMPTINPRTAPMRPPSPSSEALQARVAAGVTAASRRWVRPVLGGALALGLCYGLVWVSPRPLYGLAGVLPGPLDQPFRAAADIALAWTAPNRDGLRQINLSDPRVRKADRLDLVPPAKRRP